MPRLLTPLLALPLVLLAGCPEPGPAAGPAAGPSADAPSAEAPAADPLAASDGGAVRLPDTLRTRLVAEDPLWEAALRLHYDAVVMDGHVDTPSLMLDDGYRLGERHAPQPGRAHVDLPRMVEGGLDAPFFSIFVSRQYGEGPAATERALAMIAEVERQVAALDGVEVARSAADVLRLTRAGKKAVLLGLEGGHALQASEAVLRRLRDAGIRYVGLTHTGTHSWADSSQDAPRHDGLSEAGVALVQAMNRLGVLVDVSHASDAAFEDAIAASRAPVIASHSSARALVANPRNLTDDQLRALAENGGVAMVNFFGPVVNGALDAGVMAAVERRLAREHGSDGARLWEAIRDEAAARGLRRATLDDVLDHLDHMIAVAGADHVGLGSDFDGVPALPAGLEDATRLPWITYGLLKRGHAEADVRKVLGGNLLRVLAEAEAVAAGE